MTTELTPLDDDTPDDAAGDDALDQGAVEEADEATEDTGAPGEDDSDDDDQDTPAEAIADAREVSEQAIDVETRIEAGDAVDVAEADRALDQGASA